MNKSLSICLVLVASIGAVKTHAQTLPQSHSQTTVLPNKAKQDVQHTVSKAVAPNEVVVRIKSDSGSSSITDKHPNAVYFVIIAAGLAALASIISSTITAISSWRLKNKEYKNEYHKKIIDKRIKAIEYAEQLVVMFSYVTTRKDESKYFTFLMKDNFFEEYKVIFNNISLYNLWYSKGTTKAITEFNSEINQVNKAIKKIKILEEKRSLLSSKHKIIVEKGKKLRRSITEDLIIMDDVDGFFKTRNIQSDFPANKEVVDKAPEQPQH